MNSLRRVNNRETNSFKFVDIRYRITALILGILIVISSVFGAAIVAYAAGNQAAVKKSNYVISKLSDAQSALSGIVRERQIPALVYLKDAYTIRHDADAYSDSVATVASGQLLYIIGVDVDSGRNIWYKVRYTSDSGNLEGFVEREFLACSDARLLDWEDKYVTTIKREETASVTDCADIEAFPGSYRDALYDLKKAHPDWIFVKQNTGLDFSSSVASEGRGEYSLIWTKSCLSSWIESKYDGSWSYATDGIIAYYMDPRNFLDETHIFMFEQQTYNQTYHTESSVQKILNGSFMSGGIPGTNVSYASTFMSLAARYNISPILQAARVLQEQGVQGTSPLISGTYPGYEGYYNYYNVGAVASNPIRGGLDYAVDKGWNSRLAALEGGVKFINNNYISKGQDTLYLQKFDVDASYYGVLTHQYMQNIAAPYNEAASAYKGYKAAGLLSSTPFVFRIPVYNNMPSGRSNKPDTPDVLTVNMDKVENLPVEQSAVLTPYINGGLCEAYEYVYSSSDKSVATVDDNGVITGKKPGSATITCKAGSAGSTTCLVSVIKADIAMGDVDRPDLSVTYDPEATLASIDLPDEFAWTDDSIVPTVENNGYTATYSPDNSRFNSLIMTLDVTVDKAKISVDDIEIPSDISVAAGSELSAAALPNNFKWDDSTMTVSAKAGTYKYKAVYCLDEANYEPTEDIEIPVEVVCSEHRFSEWSEPNGGYITRECEICGEIERLKVAEQVTEEDCTTSGHNMVDGVCTRCGYKEPTLQEHTHEYTLSSDTATCTEAGVKTYTCSCGDSYTEDSPALGHHMVGNKCDRCDYVYTPTAAVTPLPTSAPTRIPTPTVVPTPTSVPTPTAVVTPTSVPTPTAIPKPTSIPMPTVIPTPTSIPTPTVIARPTIVPIVTVTPTPVVTPTPTAIPSPTAASGGKVVAQVTKIVLPTPTAVPTATVAPAPTTSAKPQITKVVVPTEQPKVTQIAKQETEDKQEAAVTPQTQAAEAVAETKPADKPTIKPAITSVVEEKADVTEDKKLTETESTPAESTENMPVKEPESVAESEDKHEDIIIEAGDGASWTISDSDESAAEMIDMSVTFGEAQVPDKAISKLKTDDYMTMSIAYDGEFGFDAKLTVQTGEEHAGKYANLYYYDPDDEKLQLIESVKTDPTGNATFDMSHASDYVITFTDKQMIAQNGSNTMLFMMLAIILVGGLAVLIFVLVRINMVKREDEDFYFDLDDDR